MGPLVFDKVRYIEINVMKVSDIILFHILYVVKIKYELMNTVATEYDIRGIINEINVNYDLKSAVKTVVKPSHVELPINLAEMPVIHVKLLLKLKSNAVKGQSVKEFRQNNEPVLTSLRKQSDDISITGLIQQCFTHHVCERNLI